MRGTNFLIIGCLLVAGCGLTPEDVPTSDPQLQPFFKALNEVDREALGFTPVPTNAHIRLERASGRAYDAMLHIYDTTRRTIAFRKTPDGYRWINEQEIHDGPGWHQSMEGTFRENILVEFQTEHLNGIPTNQLYIRYTEAGTNWNARDLTLAEALPILESWKTTPARPQPPDLPGAGDFDPGLLLFALFTLLAVVACAALAFTFLALLFGITGILLVAGIISMSLCVGFLRKSVAGGFRALFLQIGAVIGGLGGAIAMALLAAIGRIAWGFELRWLLGIGVGVVIGILLALAFNKLWTNIAKLIAKKLGPTRLASGDPTAS
jgi:hypothetical protein